MDGPTVFHPSGIMHRKISSKSMFKDVLITWWNYLFCFKTDFFAGVSEDGIDDAFDVLGEVQESIKTGKWVGDCFIYTNGVNRLNYYVGGEIVTISHLDRTM